jgi:hypothetical protein
VTAAPTPKMSQACPQEPTVDFVRRIAMNSISRSNLVLSVLAILVFVASGCGSGESTGSEGPSSSETPPTSETPSPTETTGVTEAPPGVLLANDCPDTDDCGAGFVLNDYFFVLDCSAIGEEYVTDEVVGQGDLSGTDVTANQVEGVDPNVMLAVSLPGGQCAEGDAQLSDWSAAFRGDTNNSDRTAAICFVGYMTKAQQVANGCIPPEPVIPQLSDAEVEDANATIGAFLNYVFSNDEAGATGLLSGYPDGSEFRDDSYRAFLGEFSWIRTVDDIGWTVVPSAGFSAYPVVTVATANDGGRAAAFVLSASSSDSPALIQRLPNIVAQDRVTPAPGSLVNPGDTITFGFIPVEGGARAFIDGTEIDVTVDHDSLTTSVVLPDELPGVVVLTITLATPELPAAHAVVYRSE